MTRMESFYDLLGSPEDEDSRPAETPSVSPAALPHEMDERALAGLLRLSPSMVRTKARDGIFVRSRRGQYDVAESVGRYVERLRQTSARAGQPGSDPDELRAEKLRLTRAQADKEETRVQRERGDLVPAIDVEREWASLLRDLRNALLAVPSRFASITPHMSAADIESLDAEIRMALEAVADGN